MAHFVLVHGAWHGAWCWEKLTPFLTAAGHTVDAIDLPGQGEDTTPHKDVTLAACAARARQALDAHPGKSVLVGHSMGGMTIAQAAEERPDKIAGLVYVAAFLPRDGESLATLQPPPEESALVTEIVRSADGASAGLKEGAAESYFYHDCAPEDAAWAIPQVALQAGRPIGEPVHLTPERYGRVPRAYVVCTKDRAAVPVAQWRFAARSPCDPIIEVDGGHFAFVAQPEAFAGHLGAIAEQLGA